MADAQPPAGSICEACLDAPAVRYVPAPWGGEMGVCLGYPACEDEPPAACDPDLTAGDAHPTRAEFEAWCRGEPLIMGARYHYPTGNIPLLMIEHRLCAHGSFRHAHQVGPLLSVLEAASQPQLPRLRYCETRLDPFVHTAGGQPCACGRYRLRCDAAA